ncbi:MAG: hypothetical protein MUP97_04780 [Acidimicrobiia bacterium]|nr:hypothetical protein [Acidimicrobiia bacterium]
MATDQRDWGVLLALGALFVVAENRDRVFTDETGLSGSIAVALAAAFYFGVRGWEGGAFLVCITGGLYLPHLRAKEWAKAAGNAACFGVSGVVAAAVVGVCVEVGVSPTILAFVGVPAALTYWAVNSVLLALAMTALRGGRVSANAWGLIKSDTVMLIFAVGGALCGLVMTDVGTWTGIAALTASLVALDVFVISVPAGPAVLRSAWKMLLGRVIGGAVSGLVAVALTVSLSGAVGGAVAGLVGGIVLGTIIVVGIAVARLAGARHSIDPSLLAGFALAELPLIAIAAIAGVVAALAGADAGFLVASVLVILGSIGAAWRRRHEGGVQVDDDVLLAAVTEAILDGMPDPAPRR